MIESRKIQPPLSEIPFPAIPEVIILTLDNGIPVYLIESGTEDIMRADFIFRAGQRNENTPVLSLATNLMLKEGTDKYSAVELNRLIDYHGSFINLYTEKDLSGLQIYLLNRHMEKIFELCRQMMFHPVFPEDELSTILKKQLRWFQIRRQKVQNRATDSFFESIFGNMHPYGIIPHEHDFEKVERNLVASFHQSFYVTGNMAVIISGKIPSGIGPILNKYFGDVPPKALKTTGTKEKLKNSPDRKIHVQLDGVMQNCIKAGSATINKKHPDYRDLKITDTILGGYFGSRLMKNIREDKGFTYGINSYVTSLEDSGYKVISTDLGSEHTGQAIEEIKKEISLLQTQPVKADELAIAKNYMLGEIVRMFDGPFASADSFKSAWEFGFDNNYYTELYNRVRNITPEEILDTAIKYYKIDDLYFVTAGVL
jgi:predicted Zn-dependent peptidase